MKIRKNDKRTLKSWLWHSFRNVALIPSILVVLFLLTIQSIIHEWANESTVENIKEIAREQIEEISSEQANTISRQLNGVVATTNIFRSQAARALNTSSPLKTADAQRLTYSPDGAYYTKSDKAEGGAAVFYTGFMPVGEPERQKAANLLALEGIMKDILESEVLSASLYINTFDSLNVIYPYFDVISQYQTQADVTQYNFYYEADLTHNPQKEVRWTDAYLDPAGHGWMISSIAPVYNGDFLEGVVGIDVTVSAIIDQILKLDIPYDGYGILVGRDGTILALPEDGEEDFGLLEMTTHVYEEAIKQDTFKPEDFNIYTSETLAAISQSLKTKDSGFSYIDLNDTRKAAVWTTIPETGWKLILFVPEANIYAPFEKMQSDLAALEISMLVILSLLLITYMAGIVSNSRRLSEKLAKPLLDINGLADKIGSGDYYHTIPAYEVEEFNQTAGHIVNMGTQLGITRKNLMEKEIFATTLAAIGEGILVADQTGRINLVNEAALRISGFSKEELIGSHFNDVLTIINLNSKERILGYMETLIQSGKSIDAPQDFALLNKSGEEIRLSTNISMMRSEEGAVEGIILSFRDIRKEYELEKQIESFLMVNLDILCVIDQKGKLQKVNKNFEATLGYSEEEIKGKSIMDFVQPEDVELTLDFISRICEKGTATGMINRCICKDGSQKFIEWNGLEGVGELIYASARNVTEKRLLEEKMRQAATKDGLTGLYNRNYFDSVIRDLLQHSNRYKEPISMILFDLDFFKRVNDTWGHQVGDELLKRIGRITNDVIREADILVRFGGEEFIVVMPQTALEGARTAAEKIRLAIKDNPMPTVGQCTVSIGVAEHMESESYRHWFRRLDEALYLAKKQGRNKVQISDGSEKLPLTDLHLEWRMEWESGNEDIDREHRQLMELGNRLIEASLEGAAQGNILEELEHISVKIEDHFDSENKILADSLYPDHQHHAELHRSLLGDLMELKARYIRGEILPAAFFSFLLDDLIFGHLLEEDSKYFSYTGKRRGTSKNEQN